MKNPWDVVSGFKHDIRLKCHRGIVSQWTFQVGLNVTVDKTWVDGTSRHPDSYHDIISMIIDKHVINLSCFCVLFRKLICKYLHLITLLANSSSEEFSNLHT
jgi:hypothetical protein